MGYLPVNTAGIRLMIDGVNYSNELISFDVSDDSIIGSSIITTNGTIVLAQTPTGLAVNDYNNSVFYTGQIVELDIKQPNGEFVRHPRGYLIVKSSNYNTESKEITIDVGCCLSLALNYEDLIKDDPANPNFITQLKSFTDANYYNKLPADQEYDANVIANLLTAEGACIYQDRWGYIQKINIFGSSGILASNVTSNYKFTASDVQTCLSLTPQADEQSTVQAVRVTFDYDLFGRGEGTNFTPYTTDAEYTAANTCDASGTSDVDEDIAIAQVENPSYEFITTRSEFITSETVTITTKKYNGPGKQISQDRVEVWVTKRDYLRDYFTAYVEYLQNNPVNPSDTTESIVLAAENIFHLHSILTSLTVTDYYYGSGGEQIKQIKSDSTLGAAWEETEAVIESIAGPTGSLANASYWFSVWSRVAQQSTTTNLYFPTYTEEIVVEYDYQAQATGDPWYKKTIRRSGGNLANPDQQDYMKDLDECAPEDQRTENREYIARENLALPTGLPYITFSNNGLSGLQVNRFEIIEDYTYPLSYAEAKSLESETSYKNHVDKYALITLAKTTLDRYGFTIQEALRAEFYSWYPGYPYRLLLESENRAFYMRITGATWSVNQNEAVCSFESMMVSEYSGHAGYPTLSNSQLQYLLPEVISATSSNNSIANHEATLGNSVRSVTVTVTPSPSPTPPPSPVSVAVTSLPTINPVLLKPLLSIAQPIVFTLPVRPSIVAASLIPLTPTPGPVAIQFNLPITLSFSSIPINFGTITAPINSLNMGTILTPNTQAINLGTITAPTL